MNRSTPGLPVHHQLPEFTQTHVHRVSDAIQPSHPLSSPKELYKKDLHDPDNHDGVIPHLQPDILECEVLWALGIITMNKVSGDDGVPVELFQILKADAIKVLQSICHQI